MLAKDFTIQRSNNAVQWNDIGTVPAAGNSINIQEYTFTDSNPLIGKNYYRLRQRDIDGKQDFSKTVYVDLSSTANNFLVYPNPVNNGVLQIRMEHPAQVRVYNVTGIEVLNRDLKTDIQSIDVSKLAKGFYHITNGKQSTRFVIQ